MGKRGPHGPNQAPPVDLSGLPEAGGARVIAFIERHLRVTKGQGVRDPFRIRPWQAEIIHGLFDEPRPRSGLIAIPVGNGKTSLAAALGMYGLIADDVEGAQVICVASDQRQAGILFQTARRMVELNPDLAEVECFHDKLYVPRTDSTLTALPAEPASLEGWDPSFAIIDELHVVTWDTYEAVVERSGKREESLILAISTPPADGSKDGVMWKMVEDGRLGGDDSYYFKEYAAPPDCKTDDERAWHTANPALGDFKFLDGMRAARKRMRESKFRAHRLGLWVQHDDSWLPDGAWEACKLDWTVSDGTDIVLALDASHNSDCTVLVAATVEEYPHVWLYGLWEKPPGPAGRDWQVDIVQVEDAIRAACKQYNVRECVADPFRWQRSLQVLEHEGLPMAEYPQTSVRMSPATSGFYTAVVNQQLTHDGNRTMARHVANCHLREGSRGVRVMKDAKKSTRHIDAAVAGIMALDRARFLATNTRGAWIL